MVYTVTLNPALDYVMKVGTLRNDAINRSQEEAVSYGGKGINVSVMLTRLGVENTALGFTAGFTGRELERLLKADGVACAFDMLGEGNTRINVKIRTDTELDINAGGPPVGEADIAKLCARLQHIGSGDFLVLSGSVPQSLPADIYERLLAQTDGRNVNSVVDATGEALLRTLQYRPFLVKPNHEELGELFGVRTESDEEIEAKAKELQRRGARNVLVSRGAQGALLADETGRVTKIGAARGTLVNSVGCGDSMVAGFIAGYLQTGDYRAALRLGAACGSATAFVQGLAEKSDVEKLLAQLYGDAVK